MTSCKPGLIVTARNVWYVRQRYSQTEYLRNPFYVCMRIHMCKMSSNNTNRTS